MEPICLPLVQGTGLSGRNTMRRLFCVVSILLLSAVSNAQTSGPAKIAEVKHEQALVNQTGMTLYVFDEDRDGKSYCDKTCTTP
jgi:predicted lipoprotein with Yx(FWY)xxD motif